MTSQPIEDKLTNNSNTERGAQSTLFRVVKYTIVRLILLFVTVVIGVYLTILIANLGGFVDEIIRARIGQAVGLMTMDGWLSDIEDPEEKIAIINQVRWGLEDAAGLNDPFLLRTARWLGDGLSLNWGDAEYLQTLTKDSNEVKDIILERLPNTLLLFATANVLVFVTSIALAQAVSRRYGTLIDRIIITLSPISAAPSWIHGIILIVIFGVQLHLLPMNGMRGDLPATSMLGQIVDLGRHMLMPVSAIILSIFFKMVYTWRTLFLIHAGDDYLDMAQAKGLPMRMISYRYMLRPTLPFIITNFAFLMLSIWQDAIALEILFYWPGIGELFAMAIGLFDRPVIIGLVVMFGYVLAFTVFFLDIFYALVDPRVKVESDSQVVQPLLKRKKWFSRKRNQPRLHHARETGLFHGLASFPKTFLVFINSLKTSLRGNWGEIRRYPAALVGLVIILIMLVVSIFTVLKIPPAEATRLWISESDYWYDNPRNAAPAWSNWFRSEKLPPTISYDSRKDDRYKTVEQLSETTTETRITLPFEYPYDGFPQDLVVFFHPVYDLKLPYVELILVTPDGRELALADFTLNSGTDYYLSQDTDLQRKWDTVNPQEIAFMDPATASDPKTIKGTYELQIIGLTFDPDASVDADVILYGQVHGWAGTDHRRRELDLALLWGTPIALTFGLVGAVGTAILSMLVSSVSVWYGGRVDNFIQRLSDINIVIPALPVAIMVYIMYSKSIWAILGIMILLSIFGSAIKNYRAVFIQMKQAPFIEAARAYGASDFRIVIFYLLPRVLPILIPQIVILIPSYVFLEATLAFLGVSDPYLPTWGKLIYDAIQNGALRGMYYWFLEPVALLVLTGLSFAMLGFALDSIFNPRLRQM